MSVLSPEDLDVRMDRLAGANLVRTRRAALKQRIHAEGRAGAATAARVLLRNPDVTRSMDVGELLLCVSYLGKPTVRRLLEKRRISPWCPIDEIPEHKRRLLAGDLTAHASGQRLVGVRS